MPRSFGSSTLRAQYDDEGKPQPQTPPLPSADCTILTATATALVTLEAINPPPGLPHPRRCILLTKDNPTIRIGRTSKRNTSFEATQNNAYFESAVISREHAQLELDLDIKVRHRPTDHFGYLVRFADAPNSKFSSRMSAPRMVPSSTTRALPQTNRCHSRTATK